MMDSGATESRVFGPPGCGKTHWISNKVREMADQVGGDQVSVCSMTRAAVREIVGRDIPIPEDNMTTLHARCKRAIGAGAPAETRVAEFVKAYPKYANEATLPVSLLRSIDAKGDGVDETVLTGGGLTSYEKAQILRQQMTPFKDWPSHVLSWYTVWAKWCKDEGIFDFTGWLEEAMRTDALPHQQVVFIDEAQDHTPLQIAVIRSWPTVHRILVGDDDQNIYEWSGAIPGTFLLPEIPSEREKVLSQSYRVPRSVHKVATAWIGQIRKRKPKEYAPKPEDGEVIYGDISLSQMQYDWHKLLDFFGDSTKSTMILTSCGFQLTDIIIALKSLGIPFHNPYRLSNAQWNPLGGPMRIMRSYLVGDRAWTGLEVLAWAPILQAKLVFKRGGQKRLLDMCEELKAEDVSEDLLRACILPARFDQIMAQDQTLFTTDRKIGVPGDWKYTYRILESHGIMAEPKIIVGTIHSVKGGEADDVLLFPDLSAAGNREYLGRARDSIIRLFYVGMTRAKERLILGEASSFNAVNWRV